MKFGNEKYVSPLVQKLIEIRKQQGKSQTDLAWEMGYKTAGTLRQYEQGQTQPNLVNLTKWLEALDCHIEIKPNK